MKCHYCGEPTNMTVRTGLSGSLQACCKMCKSVRKRLVISLVFKEETLEEGGDSFDPAKNRRTTTSL